MAKRKRKTRAAISKAAAAKRERFAREYVVDMNATQAAIRSGYSPKTAKAQGSRLLTYADVRKVVADLKAQIAAKYEIRQDRTFKEIARIAYGDIRTLYEPSGKLKSIPTLDEDAAVLLAGVEVEEIFEGSGKDRTYVGDLVKVKTRDKLRALDMCNLITGSYKQAKVGDDSGIVLSIRCSDGKRVR